ncbi:hypothetical protein Dimus_031393 [Dionaea muscipula]
MARRGRPRKMGVGRGVPVSSDLDEKRKEDGSGVQDVIQELSSEKLGILQDLNQGAAATVTGSPCEKTLIDAQVGLGSGIDARYLRALKTGRGSVEDGIDTIQEEKPFAGNRDINKGLKQSRVDRRGEDMVIPAETVAQEMR